MRIASFILLLFMIGGCLTVEQKEYEFELLGNNSGKLTIRYINIMSDSDLSEADHAADFKELIDSYLNGTKIEEEFVHATLISKRLYEKEGMLCGEVVLMFHDLAGAKLYQYEDNTPLMFALTTKAVTEEYIDSNGKFGGEYMPVVFWNSNSKVLRLRTALTKPEDSAFSLIGHYREWKN